MAMDSAARYGDITYYRASVPDRLEQAVEWYADFEVLKPLLSKQIAYGDNLLVVGPGLSVLHEKLHDSGYRGLTVIDAVEEVLQRWQERSESEGRVIKFQQADVLEGLNYTRYSYHAIIDKGTLDCMLCRDTGERDAKTAIHNLYDALRSPGTLIIVSHSPPDARLHLLNSCHWESIQVKVLYPPVLSDVAAGQPTTAVIQDYDCSRSSVQTDVACSYVYTCRKPY